MATPNAALSFIEHRVGFPVSRGKTVARRLVEAGRMPAGAPGKAPEIVLADVVSLILALAVDTELHLVVDAVGRYSALVPDGIDTSVMPADRRPPVETARMYLDAFAFQAANGDAEKHRMLAKLKIEVVANWPEVAIHLADGSVVRFREPGSIASHWGAVGMRKSITINGAALLEVIRDLKIRK